MWCLNVSIWSWPAGGGCGGGVAAHSRLDIGRGGAGAGDGARPRKGPSLHSLRSSVCLSAASRPAAQLVVVVLSALAARLRPVRAGEKARPRLLLSGRATGAQTTCHLRAHKAHLALCVCKVPAHQTDSVRNKTESTAAKWARGDKLNAFLAHFLCALSSDGAPC